MVVMVAIVHCGVWRLCVVVCGDVAVKLLRGGASAEDKVGDVVVCGGSALWCIGLCAGVWW